jgi:hypothetical protein
MTVYTIFAKVVSVERRMKQVYHSGLGEEAKFYDEDKGYFMLLEGSHEALHIGFDEPEFKVGDLVKITFEKVKNGRQR